VLAGGLAAVAMQLCMLLLQGPNGLQPITEECEEDEVQSHARIKRGKKETADAAHPWRG
jgi:hypothetical protein